MGAHLEQQRGFARYNAEFNQQLFERLAGLPDGQRKKDLGAFFGSIHGTLNHILLADRIWLGRFFQAFPVLKSLQGAALVQDFSSLRQELCGEFSELAAQRHATDQVILAWADELTEDLLSASMSYRNSQGQPREHPAWIAVAHLFNHQTHHRGQVTALMYQLGVDPGVTDYLMFVQKPGA